MRLAQAVVVSACLLSTACASWFMNGGKLVDSSYSPTVKASYTIDTCNMADGTTHPGPPGVVFQLVQDDQGTGIFEKGSNAKGAVITNTWSDDKADHYFGWVKSSGWEYVIPKDPAGRAARVVYVGLQTTKDGNATKPTSAPAANCPLLPQK